MKKSYKVQAGHRDTVVVATNAREAERTAIRWFVTHGVSRDELLALTDDDVIVTGFGELDYEHGAPAEGPRYGSDERE